jgi:hypothetical protein
MKPTFLRLTAHNFILFYLGLSIHPIHQVVCASPDAFIKIREGATYPVEYKFVNDISYAASRKYLHQCYAEAFATGSTATILVLASSKGGLESASTSALSFNVFLIFVNEDWIEECIYYSHCFFALLQEYAPAVIENQKPLAAKTLKEAYTVTSSEIIHRRGRTEKVSNCVAGICICMYNVYTRI